MKPSMPAGAGIGYELHIRRLGANVWPKHKMRNTTGSLFTFLEDVFALRGFGASNRPFNNSANDDLAYIAHMRAPKARQKTVGESSAANENKTRGLSPLVSVAVSVCPVPPVAKPA